MNKMEKNSSEKLLKQLIATLRLEGNQMPGVFWKAMIIT